MYLLSTCLASTSDRKITCKIGTAIFSCAKFHERGHSRPLINFPADAGIRALTKMKCTLRRSMIGEQ